MKITCPPGVLVIDVSMWDDHLNMAELIDGGIKSVILGVYKKWALTGWVLNDNCKRIADQVVASGLPLMCYFFYYVKNDPIKDANWFVDIMSGYLVKFWWADCEDTTGTTSALLRSEQNRRFMLQLHTRMPNSGMYTAQWYVNGYAPEMDKWLPHYQTWIAQYKYQPSLKTAMTWNELKSNWLPNYDVQKTSGMIEENFVGHQFIGDRIMLPGVYDLYNRRLVLDVNVFKAEFISGLGASPLPPTPPPVIPIPPQMFTNYIVLSYSINIRTGAGTGYSIAYTKSQNSILQVASIIPQNGYVRLTDGNYAYLGYLRKA